MKKLIFIILFLGTIVALFTLFYQSLEEQSENEIDALTAIPQSAALIFETDRAGDLWHDLSQSNLIWEELQATDVYFRLNEVGLALDSMLTKQPDLRSFLSDLPSVVSIHGEGSSRYNYLLAMPVHKDVAESDVIGALQSLLKVKEDPNVKIYDGVEIQSMMPRLFDQPIHVYVEDGILVISLSEILIEESIRAIQQDASLLQDGGFMKVRKTKGLDARGQLYVNYEHIKSIVSAYASNENKDLSFFKQPFAEWSALDLDLKASSASLNGFVLCNDSSEAWLGAFRDLKETEIRVFSYMPSNTAFFAYFGFGGYAEYQAKQAEIRERNGGKFKFEKTATAYDESCNCDMHGLGLKWIGSQATSFITEPASENYSQNHYAIFETTDIEQAWTSLLELENKINAKNESDADSESYKEYEIHQVSVGNFYGEILSEAFIGVEDPYFIRMDEMVVMANSVNALRGLIDAISKGQTLDSDKGFNDLSGHFSSEAQFLMYSSLARSPFIYQNILADAQAEDIEKQTDILRNFQAFIYEVSYFKNDLFYNNVFFKHNPEYEQETNALWELKMPADIIGKPHFVENHYTGAFEILVQDMAYRIYMLSNSGKVLWEKALDGPIMGEVQQVDIYKNKKLQMLFNTEKSIYMLDRNGAHVESFPVRLKAPSSAPVGVADYDQSRDYRIFIPVQGGMSYLYDATGKLIDGWKFKDESAELTEPFKHIRIRSKDYIYTINAEGKLHVLNRKGKSRHSVDSKLVNRVEQTPVLIIGEKIAESKICYVDSTGSAYVLGFDDRFEKLNLVDETVVDYAFVDVNGDGGSDWVLLTESSLEVYSQHGDEIYNISLSGNMVSGIQVFEFTDGISRIGLTNYTDSQLSLYDGDGSIHAGFPLYGESEYVIGDMNGDGNLNLITSGANGFVYAYAIEE